LNALPEEEAARLKNAARIKMQEMKPDFVIDSVADLLPIVDEINERISRGEFPKN
jgi:phosphonoacetaldehyde hydrolase